MSNVYSDYVDILVDNPLFATMGKEEILHVLACLQPKYIQFNKSDTITIEGHEFTGIGVVLSGKVKVTRVNEAGERVIMSVLEAGGVFGEMVAFSSKNTWPATVEADGECQVLFLAPNVIINHCANACVGHRQLIINMLRIVSNKALGLNRIVSYLTIKSMRGKLSKFLYEYYSKQGNLMFDIGFNRNELAEFLNVSRPSMSRELAKMKDEGIIDYYQNTFKILDVDKISDYASHLT